MEAFVTHYETMGEWILFSITCFNKLAAHLEAFLNFLHQN